MQGRARHIFELLELTRTRLDPLNAATGDAIDDLVTGRVLVLRVLLARSEDRLEDANVLSAVRLAGNQLTTFECRDAVLLVDELVLNDSFAERNHILDHAHLASTAEIRGESGDAWSRAGASARAKLLAVDPVGDLHDF